MYYAVLNIVEVTLLISEYERHRMVLFMTMSPEITKLQASLNKLLTLATLGKFDAVEARKEVEAVIAKLTNKSFVALEQLTHFEHTANGRISDGIAFYDKLSGSNVYKKVR